jgi:hypothetical protein
MTVSGQDERHHNNNGVEGQTRCVPGDKHNPFVEGNLCKASHERHCNCHVGYIEKDNRMANS